ncbi:transposase [Cyanobacteria bacterium FACHB-471]|nr:transposase [Cyanobacteria bacterium FACHB-471]
MEDIFIAYVNELEGFPEAVALVFPKICVQLCIVYLIRNSLRYVPWGTQAEVIADLTPIIKPLPWKQPKQHSKTVLTSGINFSSPFPKSSDTLSSKAWVYRKLFLRFPLTVSFVAK